jgi:hypothetical protein
LSGFAITAQELGREEKKCDARIVAGWRYLRKKFTIENVCESEKSCPFSLADREANLHHLQG